MPPDQLSILRLIIPITKILRDAWVVHREVHAGIVQEARSCFERRDWHRLRDDTRVCSGLYRDAVDVASARVHEVLGGRVADKGLWMAMKVAWSASIADRQDWDLAETFFNSVSRRVFGTVGVDPRIEFVDTDFDTPPRPTRRACARSLHGFRDAAALVEAVLRTLPMDVSWEDRGRDCFLAGRRIEAHLEALGVAPVPESVQVLEPLFYRGHGAYAVARMDTELGPVPLVMAFGNDPFSGLYLDALLMEEEDVSKLFSFVRSAFQVHVPRPYDTVRWLHRLLPRKRLGELYISIGQPKHGKTVLYRDLMHHLGETTACFVPTHGTKGMVMACFELEAFGWVFKVIRDRFPPEKRMLTPAKVAERYAWVEGQDRAGRIIDAQSFEHLTFPVDRFDPEVLDELIATCGKSVRVEAETVTIDLAYVERKVRPLNLFVREVTPEAAAAAVVDYGGALADLAASNIFPGDLLVKNFGVTRHGRVVFYDYDEVVGIGDVKFREIPEARDYDDELSAEPWYSVGPDDVFPEEFPRFLGLPRRLVTALVSVHGDLFTAGWWRRIQRRVAEGDLHELWPYGDERRLRLRPTR